MSPLRGVHCTPACDLARHYPTVEHVGEQMGSWPSCEDGIGVECRLHPGWHSRQVAKSQLPKNIVPQNLPTQVYRPQNSGTRAFRESTYMLIYVGWLAAVITVAASIPQLIKLIATRNTHGVNTWSYASWLALACWWELFGLSVHALPTILTNVLAIPLQAAALLLLRPQLRHWLFLIANMALMITIWSLAPHWTAVPASLLLVYMGIPSARQTLKSGADVSGVAVSTWFLIVVQGVAWVIYNSSIGYPLSGIADLFLAVIAAGVVYRVLKYRRLQDLPLLLSRHRSSSTVSALPSE